MNAVRPVNAAKQREYTFQLLLAPPPDLDAIAIATTAWTVERGVEPEDLLTAAPYR